MFGTGKQIVWGAYQSQSVYMYLMRERERERKRERERERERESECKVLLVLLDHGTCIFHSKIMECLCDDMWFFKSNCDSLCTWDISRSNRIWYIYW